MQKNEREREREEQPNKHSGGYGDQIGERENMRPFEMLNVA